MYRRPFMIMKNEKNILLFKKYVKITFASRIFYLPRIPADICFENNSLTIDMADMDKYVLVDGIRCYYCMTYNSDNDMVNTWLKDYSFEGMVSTQHNYFSFSLSDKEFPFSKRDPRLVVPKREYSELISAFLDEHKDLNERVVKFLKQHPETFEKVYIKDWVELSNQIATGDFDPDCLPESISDLFE